MSPEAGEKNAKAKAGSGFGTTCGQDFIRREMWTHFNTCRRASAGSWDAVGLYVETALPFTWITIEPRI